MYKYIMSIDPGGDGCSGFCFVDNEFKKIDLSEIRRNNYNTDEEYWKMHIDRIRKYNIACKGRLIVVIEDFLFNPKRANQFAGSRMETSKLIGIIQLYCFISKIPIQLVKPLDHLSRFKDDVLCKLGIIVKTSRGFDTTDGITLSNHTKDALRIAVFYNKIYNKGV